jgi:hypothetical protein
MGKTNKVQPVAGGDEDLKKEEQPSGLPLINQHRSDISFDPDIDVKASINNKQAKFNVIEEAQLEESPESKQHSFT